ncbi:MAG: hypothetical protein P0Y50_07950 [Candidatus Brevundimonas colombiensis]|uniref:Uncharacterized protein n=1 Tax=Candidatus Brevundimonas colombiensis TaxID=3121376 RepID=A0AAJ5WXQ6_9CAUL|nr:hypothetical protein [Brevundimonas sp.]WEK38487.1 MAG: hypothetical protein P0Y50_07950 [Brevundimonas sp.]
MSPELTTTLWTVPVLAGALCAAQLLRRAWNDRTASRPGWIIAGWSAVAVATLFSALVLGGARGPFIAWTLVSVAALAIVARGVQVRAARERAERGLAPEPSDRVSKAWRGWLRALLAGPLGMIAAMGMAIAFVAFCPGAAQTRLILGGLMVPVLWGGAMAWTLADDKILRATAVLIGVAVATFTAAVLKGFS